MDIVKTFSELALLGSAWVLWLLVFLSVLSIAVIFERILYFSRLKHDAVTFRQQLGSFLDRDDLQGAKNLCQNKPYVECQAVLKALEISEKGPNAMQEYVAGFLVTERHNLDRGLVVLGTLGNNAPFIGLFGTVIGIIVAFRDLSLNTTAGAAAVMAGVSEALVATAVGLIVAIPAVIAYNWFQRIVKRHLANAEAAVKMLAAYFTE